MEAGLKKAQCNHRQKEIRGRDMSWKIGNVRIGTYGRSDGYAIPYTV